MRAVEPSYSLVGVAAVHSRYAYLSIITAIDYQISDFWILWPSLFLKRKTASLKSLSSAQSRASITRAPDFHLYVNSYFLLAMRFVVFVVSFFYHSFFLFLYAGLAISISAADTRIRHWAHPGWLFVVCVCVVVHCRCEMLKALMHILLTGCADCVSRLLFLPLLLRLLLLLLDSGPLLSSRLSACLPACQPASLCLSCSFLYNMCFTNVP